ncbi:PRMT5 arginine-N-methyltransferase-domain-containing protein [Melampsora americana]|nr:PRMT5 arginine-N-methyltransferase-domain-containing protein [Melampsora americana]
MMNNPQSVDNEPSGQHWSEHPYQSNQCPMIISFSQNQLERLLLLQTKPISQFPSAHHPDHRAPLVDNNPNTIALRSFIKSTLSNQQEYDGISIPLSNSRWRARWERMCVERSDMPSMLQTTDEAMDETAELWRKDGSFLSAELNITNSADVPRLLCFVAEWLELDSPVEGIRFDCELALKQEVAFATYLGLSHLILPALRHRNFITDYARGINATLGMSSNIQFSVVVPISNPTAWEDWHTFYTLCGHHPRLSITLEMSGFSNAHSNVGRWAAEPISFVWMPATTFISNANQYPVLSKSCQLFLKGLLKYRPTIILSQTTEGKHQKGGPSAYAQYIKFLEKKIPGPNPIERYASNYLDYLQSPLQPLADNLDSSIYEGFEKDPVKYERYEEAVFRALSDRPSNQIHNIAVCGAGRGPLVQAALVAARRAVRKVKIIAVEKNPNSYVTLQSRKAHEWGDEVELWYGDMREFKPSEAIDILVSELLGSFGDNEVSPECLDGVIRWLADDGISIPASYSAFVAPMSSSKLHSKVKEIGRHETPYVVLAHAANLLAPVKEAWSFEHPRVDLVFGRESGIPITNFHNARSAHLTFQIHSAAACDGFSGYFRAVLYADVVIETIPESEMSKSMLSWFPIFFPFKEPVYVPAGSEIDIHLWRLTDQSTRKVWYEWSADVYLRVKPEASQPQPPSKGGSISLNTLETGNGIWPEDFANAPSPRIGSSLISNNSNGGIGGLDEDRIKVGVVGLQNANGKESAVKW